MPFVVGDWVRRKAAHYVKMQIVCVRHQGSDGVWYYDTTHPVWNRVSDDTVEAVPPGEINVTR